jgi:outer membrane immunogenic protein
LKNVLLGAVALVAMTATSYGADLPSRRAAPVYAPPVIPVFSWTGFYIGGQVGYGFGRDNTSTSLGGVTFASAGTNTSGIIGGGHVGYNFSTQSLPIFGGVLGTGGVIGIEGDVDGSDARRTGLIPAAFGLNPGATATVRNEIQGSIRGRLGFAVDRALFYATGGAAFAEFKHSITNPGGFPFFGGTDSFSSTRVGYTVGGGVEYAVTDNWSLRAEYRYSDFGSFRNNLVNVTANPFVALNVVNRYRETEQRVQVGFSYKFTSPILAPVVARY